MAPLLAHLAMRRPGLPAARQAWLQPVLATAVPTAGWLVLGGLGRQHAPLWASGLLPLALWLAAGACLHTPALAGLARRAARQGPLALLLLAACLWWLPLAPGPALAGLALAWAVLGLASRCAPPLHGGQPGPQRLPMALGAALGAAVGAGPVLQGTVAAWWPALLLPAALLWQVLGSGAGAVAPPPPCPAARPWRQHGTLLAARLAMVLMMASLPLMLESCRSAQLPGWAALGLHGLVMLLPAWAGCGRRLAGTASTANKLGAVALLGGGAALCWLPGWQGLMLASLLQAAAWGLVQAQGQAVTRTPWPGLQAAALVLALGLGLAQQGTSLLWLLHGLLAGAGALALTTGAALWLRSCA